MSEQADGDRGDLDPADRAQNLEQRYVGEHQETEQLLEGLDPEQSADEQTTRTVQGVSLDRGAEDDVASMSRDDP